MRYCFVLCFCMFVWGLQVKVPAAPLTYVLQEKALPADLYDRLDYLEAQEKALISPKTSLQYLNRGWTLYHLGLARAELGASAVNYLKFQQEAVYPLMERAQKDLKKVMNNASAPRTERALAAYYHGQSHDMLDLGDAAFSDYRQACEWGEPRACKRVRKKKP